MEKETNTIKELQDHLDALAIKQGLLADEITVLKQKINRLKAASAVTQKSELASLPEKEPLAVDEMAREEAKEQSKTLTAPLEKLRDAPVMKSLNNDLEEVIGRSLISKVGMVAILIGMGIGIKYAIDNDLISPLLRILMGYLVGGVLLFFSYRLRKEYTGFGAVLFSGALALMFFTSYAAHIYYGLLSQGVAFSIMVVLTIYGVLEALRFDQPVVAHFGLVGAYAIPFLLGDDPDQITFLFTYIAIINLGILSIAFWRYWKSLYYTAFGFTWLIYASWYLLDYDGAAHFGQAFVFLVSFFVIFYLAFLAYKLIKREKYNTSDVVMLLLNSFIFYGLGYLILEGHETGRHQLGLFTGLNALVHLCISAIVYRFKLADRNVFYLVSGVGLIFTIIAIPVQLDGNWVTLLWAGEAALLFWIGRTRKSPPFEKLAHGLFVLAFLSLLNDWIVYKNTVEGETLPVFNINLLTALLSAGCFGFSTLINRNAKYEHPYKEGSLPRQLLDNYLPLIFISILYIGFLLEIVHYFDQRVAQTSDGNDFLLFKDIWVINYSLFFMATLSWGNIYRLRSQMLSFVNLGLNVLFLVAFLALSMIHFANLQSVYLDMPAGHISSIWHVLIRYVSYLFVGGILWTTYHYHRQPFVELKLRVPFDLMLHIILLSVASLELYCWMKTLNIFNSFQAGLSILCGVYALILIVAGIRRSQKHLRIAAMVLVAVTLIKVILIDLADLSTLSKTMVLVILGVLLLVISFLYNKFRDTLFVDPGNKDLE